ncbi:MAG: ATP-binding protein [Candidatus Bipolaricaulaceae bacterium]
MRELRESETLELKERWTDEALKDLAAFANTRGGTLLIGVRKNGEIVGTATEDAEIQWIANTIVSRLGLTPSVRTQTPQGLNVVEIVVKTGYAVSKVHRWGLQHFGKPVQQDLQTPVEKGILKAWGEKKGKR